MAASEAILGNLHLKVAQVMLTTLERMDVDIQTASDEDIIDGIIAVEPSAAFLSAVIKFLKDNDITATASEGEGVSALSKKFEQMRAGKRMPSVGDIPVGEA